MMYRPVRERDPESIVKSILGNVDNGGYDETSLTCLSTPDYSCITPLVKTVMSKLRERKVALAVSSLRAYGLNEDLLDELASVRATGLTFAPEAGTQRMRDVVNKNVTEQHIRDSSERVFSRGWSRLKLYFMIGLPTETDEDVRGIVETGGRMLKIGREKIGGAAEVTVSVSSHVPKPHTPFQWCAMDPLDEIARKQAILREVSRATRPAVKLKYHERGISHVEGIMARGDRRLADVIEHAWRAGARFDGWDEMFDLGRWQAALEACGVDPTTYLSTIPVTARLPWDHIDIGLEDGFLLKEYRKALKDRLSPPCGKPFGSLLHHTNVEEALADKRKLVCFDCGVACDLTMMREERVVYLRKLGALAKPEPRPAPAPSEKPRKNGGRPQPSPQFTQGEGTRYRLRYTKLGRAVFISHLDVMRLLQRIFRRAKVELIYSLGFHPKPNMTFGPALGLGIAALGEMFDVRVDGSPDAAELAARLNEVSPEGIHFSAARRLDTGAPSLSKLVAAADFVFSAPGWDDAALTRLAGEFLARAEAPVDRSGSVFDARRFVVGFDVLAGDAAARLCAALDWQPRPLLTARIRTSAEGSVKPVELATLLGLADAEIARLALVGLNAAGAPFDPLDPPVPPIAAPSPVQAAGEP
jgi:radical SAM-linked protein